MRRFEQEMEVISHDDITKQFPAAADNRALQPVNQPPSVRIIADDFLTAIAPRHYMIDGAFKLDPQSPRHVRRLRAVSLAVKLRNKK